MLGLIAVDETCARMCEEKISICDEDFLCITIPKLRKRYLKRAAKKLSGLRVIIPDNSDEQTFKTFGINVVCQDGLLFRLAYRIYEDALLQFGLDPNKISLSVRSTKFGISGRELILKLIKRARYLSLCASDVDTISEELLSDYGIAVFDNAPANIEMYLYEKNFSLHIIISGIRYILRDVVIDIKIKKFSAHAKGIANALMQAGRLTENDISIVGREYVKEKLT